MRTLNINKCSILLIGIFLFFHLTSNAQDVNAYAFNSEPVIDGIIDDGWNDNEFLEISHFLSSEQVSEENFSGKFKVSWYNNSLYFLFEVTDDSLVLHTDMPIWLGDNINLYLDLGNEKGSSFDDNDHLFHFKWGNSEYFESKVEYQLVKIENSKTGVEFAQQHDAANHKLTMEIAIRNVSELNGPAVITDSTTIGLDSVFKAKWMNYNLLKLSDSTTIGLDAALFDADDEGIYTNVLSWVDTTGLAWDNPSKFGTAGFATIRLKSAKTPAFSEKMKIKNRVKIFPTMVSNTLNIQPTSNEDLKVEICNILGEKMESAVLRSGNSCLDVTSLKSGLYFVNVYNLNGFPLGSQRILKSGN
jgi:hypothetical protein